MFFDVSTRSIPAQTTPRKLIVLDHIAELPMVVQELINQDHYTKDGVNMIPLRDIADHLGYHVKWHQETLSVLLSKPNRTFRIRIGEKGNFTVSPDLIDGKSYVPDEFLHQLLQNEKGFNE